MFGDTIFGDLVFATVDKTGVVIPTVKWRVQCPNEVTWTEVEPETSIILQCSN